MSKRNRWTQGRIYQTIIDSERRGDYLGKTIQINPHVTNQIKDAIKADISDATGPGVIIVEIGGTVGDIESRTRNNANTTKLSTQKTRNLAYLSVLNRLKLMIFSDTRCFGDAPITNLRDSAKIDRAALAIWHQSRSWREKDALSSASYIAIEFQITRRTSIASPRWRNRTWNSRDRLSYCSTNFLPTKNKQEHFSCDTRGHAR